MRILKYGGKLVEEIANISNEKVVILKYVSEKDMSKCECGRAIDQEMNIVEGCLNWKNEITGVETLILR